MKPSAPPLPGVWDAHRITLVLGFAAVAPLTVAVLERGAGVLILPAIGLALFWQFVFSRLRHRPMAWDGIVTALVFAMLAPAAAPLWQQGLALSFGLVFGDLIFGGRGRGFLNPATVGLAFLLFSFPHSGGEDLGPMTALAAMGSGILLLGVGLLSWRVAAGFCLSLVILAPVSAMPEVWPLYPNATLVLGLVFLVGDPVAAACTNPGRWAYGLLAGLLVALFWHEGSALSAVVFAALLASLFAPLIDQTVVWLNVRRRARRGYHG